jgi:hypothetical protein
VNKASAEISADQPQACAGDAAAAGWQAVTTHLLSRAAEQVQPHARLKGRDTARRASDSRMLRVSTAFWCAWMREQVGELPCATRGARVSLGSAAGRGRPTDRPASAPSRPQTPGGWRMRPGGRAHARPGVLMRVGYGWLRGLAEGAGGAARASFAARSPERNHASRSVLQVAARQGADLEKQVVHMEKRDGCLGDDRGWAVRAVAQRQRLQVPRPGGVVASRHAASRIGLSSGGGVGKRERFPPGSGAYLEKGGNLIVAALKHGLRGKTGDEMARFALARLSHRARHESVQTQFIPGAGRRGWLVGDAQPQPRRAA